MNQPVSKIETAAPTTKAATSNAPMSLIELAITQDADVVKIEKLMDLQERWEEKEAKKAYFHSLSYFQSDLPTIKKTKTAKFPTSNGGEMSYNYASLDDICEQIKPFLRVHGLSYRFEQHNDGFNIKVKCIVTHEDGHSEHCIMQGTPDSSGKKNNIQQMASTVTYLRRYSLEGAFGIATAAQDIDGRLPARESKPEIEDAGDFKFYPDHLFVENFPKWKKGIIAEKVTPQSVITRVQSIYTLTDEQISQIQKVGAA